MKIARRLWISLLGFFVPVLGAGAAPTAPDPEENPYAQADPDGVPIAVTRPQKKATQEEVEALHKAQVEAELNKNWLLRSYEQQLQNHDAADPAHSNKDSNLYYQLSSDKELAKLAGIPYLDPTLHDGSTTFRTSTDHPDSGTVSLRTDPSSAPTPTADPEAAKAPKSIFQPLVTPLGAPDAAGLHNFYSSLPVAMTPPFAGTGPTQPAPAPTSETPDIDTPGMVAAEKDPLMDKSSYDLTLDILPGETPEQAREHQENNSKLELPEAPDADQLHREQAAALTPLGATKTVSLAPVVKPAPIDFDAPLPVNKIPPISPVRGPIANPYDILNR
jgi:hypothetical protein